MGLKISKKRYEYVVIGGGIAGCSVAYFLSQKTGSVLLIEKNQAVAAEASGAAGAFLSPMIGKPNTFKDLVTEALSFSVEFYKEKCEELIVNKGVLRLPSDKKDLKHIEDSSDYFDFPYEFRDGGVFFPIGSQVDSQKVCEFLAKDTGKLFNYQADSLEFKEGIWKINGELEAKNIILTTGHDTALLKEEYLGVRPVWGQRINISTTTSSPHNFHKECSVSPSYPLEDGRYLVSIGATHHRLKSDYEKIEPQGDTELLLKRAADIIGLKEIEFLDYKRGGRAATRDYFPIVGEVVNSEQTLEKIPYIKKGSKVPDSDFLRYENLHILNGMGGRGFVFGPYLGKMLAEHLVLKQEILEDVKSIRLFKRWARKLK